VDKKIPYFAGLGGGSSNCATFILAVNELCNLNLTKKELSNIGIQIGADVPFFIYEYDSANVSGIGEIVEKFKEDSLDINIFTPKIECNTGNIFKLFRAKYYKELSLNDAKELFKTKSKDILNTYDIFKANDLYLPVLKLYPTMKPENFGLKKDRTFFSGSGSSFFYLSLTNGLT
jgi:4-diphosphocytidyl-2-C-methyl-D-erythritol kinase